VAAERAPVTAPLTIDEIARDGPVIAVVTIESAADAVPLARALCAGGIRVIEVTLRSAAALEAITRIAADAGEAIVGAGTARSARDIDAACAAGARFVVSPGFTAGLDAAARKASAAWLPGVATASEILLAQEAGRSLLKLYPAEQSGGPRALASFATVFPDVGFCPTGGVTAMNLREYLLLPNVVCVGGSWVASREAVRVRNWERIQSLAGEAVALGRAS
jgi:2-dehydro-3-deoxyphosphogluconate aldolase/(4S)-4-hydroxy-2-oxoglutarate aldolase